MGTPHEGERDRQNVDRFRGEF